MLGPSWSPRTYTPARSAAKACGRDDAFDQFTAAQELLTCSIRDNKVHAERMRQALDRDFAVATDFADALVIEWDVSFRTRGGLLARECDRLRVR